MRIFEGDGRINFVDENDVYVGFDDFQSCCESFGHRFETVDGGEVAEPVNLEDLRFDPEFYEECYEADGWMDGGGEAKFRLVHYRVRGTDAQSRAVARQLAADGLTHEVFLVLYNHHNGYYGHGFEVKIGGEMVRSGCL